MSDAFVSFDTIRDRVNDVLEEMEEEIILCGIDLYLVRDLFGKLRISVKDEVEEDKACRERLQVLALRLHESLGVHGYPPDIGVLFVDETLLTRLKDTAHQICQGVYWADRLVTGRGWWTVGTRDGNKSAKRFTLFSVKGGMGRSTTSAVLAWHLARTGEQVLVVDLDLESPGVSSAMLEPERRPKFGVVDWFVEDLVKQGDHVIDDLLAMPAWVQDCEGDVRVVPAHGSEPGEYLAKLGRVYMDADGESWTERLERLLARLETEFNPTVVLLESRSGLHDIAAATITDLDAEVLLFATDSESAWTDYDILFRHWSNNEFARQIRERLWLVSALTPVTDKVSYLQRFRQRAWDLFREALYDEVNALDESDEELFSYDLDDEDAPHNPMEINWTLGLAAGASLYSLYLEMKEVELAYAGFLARFDKLIWANERENTK